MLAVIALKQMKQMLPERDYTEAETCIYTHKHTNSYDTTSSTVIPSIGIVSMLHSNGETNNML